jgi:hypothetical protein
MSEARFLQVTNQGTDSAAAQRVGHRTEYVRRWAINESPFAIANVVHVKLEPNVNTIVLQLLCESKNSLLVVVVYFEFRFHFLYFLKNSCIKMPLFTCSASSVVVYLFNFKRF